MPNRKGDRPDLFADLSPRADAGGFPRSVRPDSPALDGLDEELIDAITDEAITPEMVGQFVACLSASASHAEAVRLALVHEPWFPGMKWIDTQLRFVRRLRDRAIILGFPVCSMNGGYLLGDRALVRASAARARALARGAEARADALERLAALMPED